MDLGGSQGQEPHDFYNAVSATNAAAARLTAVPLGSGGAGAALAEASTEMLDERC
jgi:hypothetical protein